VLLRPGFSWLRGVACRVQPSFRAHPERARPGTLNGLEVKVWLGSRASKEGRCWHAGDHAGKVEALLAAGARLPERLRGSEAVREVLRPDGMTEE
jgi:hypothetical protein